MNPWNRETVVLLNCILCLICEMRTGDGFALINKVHCSLKIQSGKGWQQRRDILLVEALDTSKGTVWKLKF